MVNTCMTLFGTFLLECYTGQQRIIVSFGYDEVKKNTLHEILGRNYLSFKNTILSLVNEFEDRGRLEA